MKRLLLAAAAALALLAAVSPRAVQADEPTATTTGNLVSAIVNPILALVPAPDGWHERSICVGNEQVNKAWCFYFAWPL